MIPADPLALKKASDCPLAAATLLAPPREWADTQKGPKGQRAVTLGFTLIEMLIVLAIAGIVMGTLVPSFGPAIARAQLYSASRDVASALRYTRGHAMIRGEDALFELNTIHHTYRVSGRPKLYRLPPGIELGLFTTATETLDEGTGRIRFFPDGSATGGRVTLIAAKQTRVVDINWLTGEITIGEEDSGDH